jgi:catechol 2,3-dioxygenase-like lactoylglutathione lyase family enzyme
VIDHMGFAVADIKIAKAFYDKALEPLGLKVLIPVKAPGFEGYGYGRDRPDFWIGAPGNRATGLHIAFAADSRAQVDAFYAAAIAAGGRDNGAPGLRPNYHPNYYGAFVFDLDGNNIEAVCHKPE